MKTRDEIEDDYRDNVGRAPHNLPPDHPDRWQWEYSGSREEREMLLDRLAGNDMEACEDEPPSQEESLF